MDKEEQLQYATSEMLDTIKEILQYNREENKKYRQMALSCLISVIIFFTIAVGSVLYFLSAYSVEVEDTVTTTTEQSAEGENAEINNIEGNQYKDNSTHNEGVDD